MKIAIWTTRKAKVEGIKEGINKCPYFKNVEVEYILEKVPSDISDMPLSLEEIMQGSKNRARNLKKKWIEANFYIWIEGWTYILQDKAYLLGIVYIENKEGEGHFGFSPAIEVPEKIRKMLYEKWKELWPIMEELSWVIDIRSENGSMGAWSDDMLQRKDEFVQAFQSGISPFFNKYYKI